MKFSLLAAICLSIVAYSSCAVLNVPNISLVNLPPKMDEQCVADLSPLDVMSPKVIECFKCKVPDGPFLMPDFMGEAQDKCYKCEGCHCSVYNKPGIDGCPTESV